MRVDRPRGVRRGHPGVELVPHPDAPGIVARLHRTTRGAVAIPSLPFRGLWRGMPTSAAPIIESRQAGRGHRAFGAQTAETRSHSVIPWTGAANRDPVGRSGHRAVGLRSPAWGRIRMHTAGIGIFQRVRTQAVAPNHNRGGRRERREPDSSSRDGLQRERRALRETLGRDLAVTLFNLDADGSAAKPLCRHKRCATTHKWVKHQSVKGHH